MENDETFLTGAEGSLRLDENTLACTPAPLASSSVLRDKWSRASRSSSGDRSSLGLLPSGYLLGMSQSLLPLKGPGSAEMHTSGGSRQEHQLLDSGSLDSGSSHDTQMTTIKKRPLGSAMQSRGTYNPQALFQTVAEENENSLKADSGRGQSTYSSSHISKVSDTAPASVLGNQSLKVTQRNDRVESMTLATVYNQQDEADHTIHQVDLEAEDLKELEDNLTEFEVDSSDEEMGMAASVDKKDLHERCESPFKSATSEMNVPDNSTDKAEIFPNMDGPFKMPLPPKQAAGHMKSFAAKEKEASSVLGESIQFQTSGSGQDWGPSLNFGDSIPFQTTGSVRDCGPSLNFGDSIPFQTSGSVQDWGPSLNFGGSSHMSENLVDADKENMFLKDEGCQDTNLSKIQTSSSDELHLSKQPANKQSFMEQQIFNPFESFQFDNNLKTDHTLQSQFGQPFGGNTSLDLSNFPTGTFTTNTSHGNPFGNFEDEGNEGFGDEDFQMDADAAKALLAEDEKRFNQENFCDDQAASITLGSTQGEDQTFMNMTIGSYMAAKSEEVGSLYSRDKRPDLGMPVKSPPRVRPAMPILSPHESHIVAEEERSSSLSKSIRTKEEESNKSVLSNSHLGASRLQDDVQETTANEVTMSEFNNLLEKSNLTFSDSAVVAEYNRIINKLTKPKNTSSKKIKPPSEASDTKSANEKIMSDFHNVPERSDFKFSDSAMVSEYNRGAAEATTKPKNMSDKRINPPNEASDTQFANLTSVSISRIQNETSATQPSVFQEKRDQLLPVQKPKVYANLSTTQLLHQLQTSALDSTSQGQDEVSMLQMQSLLSDNSSSLLQHSDVHEEFASSTPLSGHKPDVGKFNISNQSILPVVTPKTASNILELPQVVQVPEVCCVKLSQQTSFAIRNLLDRGVKCLLTFGEVTFRGQRIRPELCPFEIKRQVILSPASTQNVEVIFCPKLQGEFVALVEILAQNMTNPQEKRSYTLHLSAEAEFPSLKISPTSDEMDFGDLLWGGTACKSVRIKNVGRATVPLRFSIVRKESSLCSFSFYPENPTDVSSISLTTRPAGVGSVYSVSLPGRKDGEEVLTKTVNIYCRSKEPQNVSQRYSEEAERYQATLSLGMDMPVEDSQPLSVIRLHVTVGMFKLHVDRDTLSISTPPGKSGSGSVKIINSGNIPMPVDIYLEPQRDNFALSTDHVVVPSGGNCPVHVTFTPQPTREGPDDNRVNLMLCNQVSQHYVSIVGKLKKTNTKVKGSTTAVNFGGVAVGETIKEKFTFVADNDDDVRVSLQSPSDVFQLLNEDGNSVTTLELRVMKGRENIIWISFSPLDVKGYCADLKVQILYANRYSIALHGYGGRSKLKIDGVSEAETGERWFDVGRLNPGTSIVRKFLVTNTGHRCCFIRAAIYDVSRLEFQPHRATVMPSACLVPPNESTELLMMFRPTQKEVDLCSSGSALVAIIKLSWGDEVLRQMFLRNPGKQPKQSVNEYDIDLTAPQRQIVDSELESISPATDNYAALKKSISVIKIGLIGQPAETQSSASPAVRLGVRMESRSSPAVLRPALAQVNPNIRTIDSAKDEWTVEPHELQLNVEDSPTKDIGQIIKIINFSAKELQFSVEHVEGLLVVPTEITVKPKNTSTLEVRVNLAHFANKDLNAWCGLVKVHCSHKSKFINVHVRQTPSKLAKTSHTSVLMPTLQPAKSRSSTHAVSVSPPSGHPKSQTTRSLHSHSTSASERSGGGSGAVIHGSDMVMFPTIEANTKHTMMYIFQNSGREPLSWTLSHFTPPYVKHSDETENVYKVGYEVFKLSPRRGVLQPDDTQTVSIDFHPQSKGSFNQAWILEGLTSFHRFSVYAKASPAVGQSRDTSRCLSATESMPVGSTSSAGRLPASKSSPTGSTSSYKSDTSGSDRSKGTKNKYFHLVEDVIRFPKLQLGESKCLKILLKNPTDEEKEVVVEYEPKPPFLVKDHRFKVGKHKMVMFPVTFKPRHTSKFKDKIVFRETLSKTSLTAVLEAETEDNKVEAS